MKSIYRKYFKIGIIFWAVCFIVLFFSYLLVLAPQEKQRRETDRNLNEKKALAQSATEAAEEKNKAKLIELLTDSGNNLKDFVVDPENAANLPLDIGRIPDDVQLYAFSSNFAGSEGATKTDNYKHIIPRQISVTFNSSFNMFAVFLNTLEMRRPVIFVDTFSITRSSESGSGHKVDMKLAVLVGKKAET
ncbi:MAG: GspMb/PilO family protein [Planctomycetota bacterium]|jgi:hypothetical protein